MACVSFFKPGVAFAAVMYVQLCRGKNFERSGSYAEKLARNRKKPKMMVCVRMAQPNKIEHCDDRRNFNRADKTHKLKHVAFAAAKQNVAHVGQIAIAAACYVCR